MVALPLSGSSRAIASSTKFNKTLTILAFCNRVGVRMHEATRSGLYSCGGDKFCGASPCVQIRASCCKPSWTIFPVGFRSWIATCACQILDLPDSLFAGGPPLLEELFRFNAGRRDYGPGDIEKLVAERMVLAKARKPHEFERRRPDGTTVEVRGVPVEGGGFVTTYVDITERRRSEARIEHMAHHDALTGLPNRVLFYQRLDDALARIARSGNRSEE